MGYAILLSQKKVASLSTISVFEITSHPKVFFYFLSDDYLSEKEITEKVLGFWFKTIKNVQ